MMAHFPATLGAMILLGFIDLSAAKDVCDLYGAVGANVTLPLAHNSLSNQDILRWTHGNRGIFYIQRGRLSVGRPEDITPNGSLILRNLQPSRAGTYQADLLDPSGKLVHTWTGNLCVMNKVSKPKLTHSCDTKSPTVHLKCEIDNPRDLVFSWTLDGHPMTIEKKQTLSISMADLRGKGDFTCSVANRVSQEKSDTVRPACKSPSPSLPQLACYEAKTIAAVLAGGAGLILLLLIIIVVLCITRGKVNERGPRSKEELKMLSVNKREADYEYETMRVSDRAGPQGPRPTPQTCYDHAPQAEAQAENTATDGHRPSPVPKPRTKNHQAPNY